MHIWEKGGLKDKQGGKQGAGITGRGGSRHTLRLRHVTGMLSSRVAGGAFGGAQQEVSVLGRLGQLSQPSRALPTLIHLERIL